MSIRFLRVICSFVLKTNYARYKSVYVYCIRGIDFLKMSHIEKIMFFRNPGKFRKIRENPGKSRKFPEIPRKIPWENSGFFLIFRL